MPSLFPLLRVLADRLEGAKFLLLGSASPELVKGVSESLAGRVRDSGLFHSLQAIESWEQLAAQPNEKS